MVIAECIVRAQSSRETETTNPPAAQYVVIAVLAVVLGLVAVILFRTGGRRKPKR